MSCNGSSAPIAICLHMCARVATPFFSCKWVILNGISNLKPPDNVDFRQFLPKVMACTQTVALQKQKKTKKWLRNMGKNQTNEKTAA